MFKRIVVFLGPAMLLLLALMPPATAKAIDGTWTEGVRIRIANPLIQEVVDFTATNRIVDGNQTSDIHVVVGEDDVIVVNSPLIPLSGRPNDQVRINQNLVTGRIDTVVFIFNHSTGRFHELEIHVDTLATPSTHPYAYDPIMHAYTRMAETRRGYLLLDGNLWYDLDSLGDNQLLIWNFSTREPGTE
jgi:hypothetical protein